MQAKAIEHFLKDLAGSSGGPEGIGGLDEGGASISILGSCFLRRSAYPPGGVGYDAS